MARQVTNDIYIEKFTTPEKYIKAKLKMLRRDFGITPSIEEIEHLNEFKTEISIDNAVRTLILRHLDAVAERSKK